MMGDQKFLDSLEDLAGRIAIVTGGAAGIGLYTTIYLARKGCTVYVASRNKEKSLRGIAEAQRILDGHGGPIRFHQLDLGSIETAKRSADTFKERETRIDIMVANAGVSMPVPELSKDGYERTFATNHIGHFVFVTSLFDLIEASAKINGQARIVVVSSSGYQGARKLDYEILEKTEPGDGTSITHIPRSFQRYLDSKLANIYFAKELDERLQARGIKNIYCNACHPGVIFTTGLGDGGIVDQTVNATVAKVLVWITRSVVSKVGNTSEDGAKTQIYLAAGKSIPEKNIHGQYWSPIFSWTQVYVDCHELEVTALANDKDERKKLWDLSEAAVKKYEKRQGL